MRRWLLGAAVLPLALAGCGGNEGDPTDPAPAAQSSEATSPKADSAGDPLKFVDDPTKTEQAAFVKAFEKLPIERSLQLVTSNPSAFRRMAVYPNGEHLQIWVAHGSINQPGADKVSGLPPELRDAVRSDPDR